MALITNNPEVQSLSSVAAAFDFNKIKPYFEPCEMKYLIPAIGPEMYAALNDAYAETLIVNSTETLSESLQLLWNKAAKALIELTLFEAYADLQINVSASGMQRVEAGSMKSAYQYQTIAWKKARKNQGFSALDELIAFLESDIDNDEYEPYKSSSIRLNRLKLLVQNTDIFNSYADRSIDRWTFIQMAAIIKRVETITIAPILGDQYAEIQNAKAEDDLTDEQNALLALIQPAIIHLSFSQAIQPLSINVNEDGVTVFNSTNARNENEMYQPVASNYLWQLEQKWNSLGNMYCSMLNSLVNPVVDESLNTTHALGSDTKGFAFF